MKPLFLKLLQNVFTLLTYPGMIGEYLEYQISRARYGEPIRVLAGSLKIGGLSGFGEFHASGAFLSAAEQRFLNKFPFGDGPILDVGANVGIFSLLMAGRYPERIIHAFEPNPRTHGTLAANLARNQRANAHAHPQAVAAHEGEVLFEADPVNRATTHIVREENAAATTGGGSPVVRVPSVTLDLFLKAQQIDQVALLKVDVEGFEDLVFQGGEEFLGGGRVQTVYYEVCPELTVRAGFEPEAASRRLEGYGYRLHWLDEEGKLQPGDLAKIKDTVLSNWVATRS